MAGKKISQKRSQAMRAAWAKRRAAGTDKMKGQYVGAPVAAALCSGGVDAVKVPPEPNQVLAAVGLARTLLHVCDGDLTTATTLLKAAASPLEVV